VRERSEKLWRWAGVHPLRCRECRTRFVDRTWRLSSLNYARCPNCWRTDLARWAEQDHAASLWQRLLLRVGAKPYRCEYCRKNFVDFRPRRTRYRRRQPAVQNAAPTAETIEK
jgi:hypothetical protein